MKEGEDHVFFLDHFKSILLENFAKISLTHTIFNPKTIIINSNFFRHNEKLLKPKNWPKKFTTIEICKYCQW